jgi:hypothetical protein
VAEAHWGTSALALFLFHAVHEGLDLSRQKVAVVADTNVRTIELPAQFSDPLAQLVLLQVVRQPARSRAGGVLWPSCFWKPGPVSEPYERGEDAHALEPVRTIAARLGRVMPDFFFRGFVFSRLSPVNCGDLS